jgi:DNA-binding transcriptional LysR family regulator
MNFHRLQIFHTGATHGSFTQAANERLFTQPAVSIQIQKLEEEYQIKVFDRGVGKGRSMTHPFDSIGCQLTSRIGESR